MNLYQALNKARRDGRTEIRSSNGWEAITTWQPYITAKEGSHLRYEYNPSSRFIEEATASPRGPRGGFGRWPVR